MHHGTSGARCLGTVGFLGGSIALLAACNGIFGISEAQVDTSLTGGDGGEDASALDAGADGDGGAIGDGGAAGDGGEGGAVVDSPYALDCNSYCDVVASTCKVTTNEAGAPENDTEYINAATCHQFCQYAWPNEHGGVVPESPAPESKDTLACRIWHTNYAQAHGAREHCAHGGPLGGLACGNDLTACTVFCAVASRVCGDVYETPEACMRACLPGSDGAGGFKYDVGAGFDDLDQGVGSNTLNCRVYHLQAAMAFDKVVHCPHVAPSGGGKCVDAVAVPPVQQSDGGMAMPME